MCSDSLDKVNRIFCIGRNYAAHAAELKNEIPSSPVVFMKPPHCLVAPNQAIAFPKHGSELHHEAELVIKVGQAGRPQNISEADKFIEAFTLGLDLTLRDVQQGLKQKGLPWEKAKAFEQSAPLGNWVVYDGSVNLNTLHFTCEVNGETKQQGDTGLMLFSVHTLLVELGKIWTLRKSDLIFTGTPAGVGPLAIGDTITISSEHIGSFSWSIVE